MNFEGSNHNQPTVAVIMQDALYAQLLSMGFEPDQIEECQVAMAQSSPGSQFNLQAATEWLLRRSQQGPSSSPSLSSPQTHTTPPLRLTSPPMTSDPDIHPAISSRQEFSAPSQPMRSRYNLGEDHTKEKERYAAKEREEVVRKAREKRVAEIKARHQVKRQIADDRKAMQDRSKRTASKKQQQTTSGEKGKEGDGGGRGGGESEMNKEKGGQRKSDVCRVQVRFPSGKVLRHNFSPTATLDEVATFVMSSEPKLHSVQLVQLIGALLWRWRSGRTVRRDHCALETYQMWRSRVLSEADGWRLPERGPFPHHEFTPEEALSTLLSLGLCPSVSLVVSSHAAATATAKRKMEGQAEVKMEWEEPQSGAISGHPAGNFKKDVFGRKHPDVSVHFPPSTHQHDARGVFSGSGHTFGGGPGRSQHLPHEGQRLDELRIADDSGEAMETEPGQQDKAALPHSDSSDDDDDDPSNQQPPFNFPPPQPHLGLPPAFGRNVPPHFPQPRGHVHFPPGHQAAFMGGDDDELFGGEGHRLGGKEARMVFGDAQRPAELRHDTARKAAMKRAEVAISPVVQKAPHLHTSIPSLETLCTRAVVGWSSSYGLPSCSSLTPLAAQRLLGALMEAKRLHPKTLPAFYGCHLQSIHLDNYVYATNELLSSLRYLTSLTHLSLGSCTMITDKAVMSLFPYLSGLTYLNLNGCRQLNETICRSIRCCKSIEVLRLSHVKVLDRGLGHLLHQPLESLRELDLSHTLITSRSLELLPRGTPKLEILSIESTKVDTFASLCQLAHLHTLSVAHCSEVTTIGSLCGCSNLHSLNLSGVAVDCSSLQQLEGLNLNTLKLPDRNLFFDDAMEIISKFPLSSLSLMDYCHVTDAGVACIVGMHTLTELSLSRTKLTDDGMPFLEGLTGLRQLSLDNTLITDEGIRHIAGLVGLDYLSLSDTKVTSQFILDGTLKRLNQLSKLNLSRTAVCDRGVMNLSLPSLTMLNLDWTCVTEASSLEYLRTTGCPILETLRNRNIGQPLPGHRVGGEEEEEDG